MELIVKSNNEQSIAKIVALARKLKVSVEKRAVTADEGQRDTVKNRILNFKAKGRHPFGDAVEWQKQEREDRNLPFS